jgi:hypothetical protein
MTNTTLAVEPLRCFAKPPGLIPRSGWVDRWQLQYPEGSWCLPAPQEQALSSLVPLLLCGEQSAQQVFHHQAGQLRLGTKKTLALVLQQIEQEEEAHERALQGLAAALCVSPDLHQRKRRSQQFYASLARDVSLGQHFARIEILDACVCRIMHALSRASWGESHPLYYRFDASKAAEARHVGSSRRYGKMLGIGDVQREQERRLIGTLIVDFLAPDAAAFECLGVDPARLFKQLHPGLGEDGRL